MDAATSQVLTGIVTAAATLAGAVTGAAVLFLIDRSRQRYDDRHRFAVDKRALYAHFLRESDEFAKSIELLVSHHLGAGDYRPLDGAEAALPKTEPLERLYDEIALIASAQVLQRALELVEHSVTYHHQALMHLERGVNPYPEFYEFLSSWEEARRRFVREARDELSPGKPSLIWRFTDRLRRLREKRKPLVWAKRRRSQ